MRTYRELFGVREFRTLFGTNCLTMATATLGGLALGTLTFEVTGSPALTALAMFGAPVVSVIGSLTLLSAADALPPRRAMVWFAAVGALLASAQAIPGLPLWLRFVALAAMALVGSVTAGAKPALLADVLPSDAFVLGRSTLNLTVGVMQIAGYGVGGFLLLWIAPSQLFLIGAVLSALAVFWLRFGLVERPARSVERTSLRQTGRVNRELWSGAVRRPIFLSLWVPNGLIVGCEALFVPYAEAHAGYLLAAAEPVARQLRASNAGSGPGAAHQRPDGDASRGCRYRGTDRRMVLARSEHRDDGHPLPGRCPGLDTRPQAIGEPT